MNNLSLSKAVSHRSLEKEPKLKIRRRDHYRIYTEQDLVKESVRFFSTQNYAAVRFAKNEYEALVAMKKAGYAEGDNYAETIMKINKDIKAHARTAILASQAQQA